MNETIVMVLGLYMVYSLGHFAVIQNSKVWKDRTGYEKFVTGFAMFVIVVILLDAMK